MLMHVKKVISVAMSLTALGLSLSAHTVAEPLAEGISNALDESDIGLELRYRYEFVDQDGAPEDANASTLRSRVNVKSGSIGGFQGFIEVDNVSYVGNDNFNNTENGKLKYPVVADPDYTEVNQAFVSYAFDDRNKASVGRQRINHSGQRFLGGVGWRQNEQTFDAASVQLTPLEGLTVDYSYIWGVNRIFGPEGADADFEGDSHALIASYRIADGHKLSAFSYLLDLEEAPALSSSTYGLEYQGAFKVNESIGLGLNLAYAQQSDYKDSALDYDAGYYLGELSAKFRTLSVTVGYEVLESDNGIGFKTPLATLHKFQGFADKFLVTPAGGIEDRYVKIVTAVAGIKLIAFYHDFEAETGGMNYGSEFDFIAVYKISKNYSVLFKYAAYDADDFATDTDKAWLMLTAAF